MALARRRSGRGNARCNAPSMRVHAADGVTGNAAEVSRHSVITRIGPFNTQEPVAWMFPIGTIMLLAAVICYATLIAVAAISGSMTCSIENRNALALALLL